MFIFHLREREKEKDRERDGEGRQIKRENTQKHTHRGGDTKTRISINRKEYILKKITRLFVD